MVSENALGPLVWIDTETTGVNPYLGDRLLEVAVRITDKNGAFLDTEDNGYHAIVHHTIEQSQELYGASSQVVKNMHSRTGLWSALSSPDAKDHETIDEECLAYIRKYVPEECFGRLAGNSVKLDREFMDVFLPKTSAWLHYRVVDNSSTAYVLEALYGKDSWYPKRKNHDAYGDIMESIGEYRQQLSIIRDGSLNHQTFEGAYDIDAVNAGSSEPAEQLVLF